MRPVRWMVAEAGSLMERPPSRTRGWLWMKLAGSKTKERTAWGMGRGVAVGTDGVLEGLAGMELRAGRLGGGLMFEVGHDAAGLHARIRRGWE